MEGLAGGYSLYDLTKIHVGRKARTLFVDDGIERHEGEDVAVGMVGEEFAFAGQTHGVDAMGLEGVDGQIRAS